MEGKRRKVLPVAAMVLCTAALGLTAAHVENMAVDAVLERITEPAETPEILRLTEEIPCRAETGRETGGKSPQTRIFTLCDVDLEDDFQIWLQNLCAEYGVDYTVIVAMADVESGFNPHAVGADGELGMWQVMPSTAAEAEEALGRRLNLFDPWDSAEAAVWLMAHYTEKYGGTVYALMAYSMGETAAREEIGSGAPRSIYAACVAERAAGYGYRTCGRGDGDV